MARTREEVRALLEDRIQADGSFAGFFPPDGWLDLVLDIHEGLLANPNYRIGQVKEKYGSLRFYADGLTDAEQDWVWEKENESLYICQACGSRYDVDMRGSGWVRTTCLACESITPAPLS